MILHLIRHPKPLIKPGICYGQLDISAENPASLAFELRQKIPLDVPVWSSPLKRCRALAEALHPAPQFDDRLMEMNFGEWEGRPWDEVPRAELDAWANDIAHYMPPGGESAFQVQQRLSDFFAKNNSAEMALVTHAGVIKILLSSHKKQRLSSVLGQSIPYGGLTTIYSFCHISISLNGR